MENVCCNPLCVMETKIVMTNAMKEIVAKVIIHHRVYICSKVDRDKW